MSRKDRENAEKPQNNQTDDVVNYFWQLKKKQSCKWTRTSDFDRAKRTNRMQAPALWVDSIGQQRLRLAWFNTIRIISLVKASVEVIRSRPNVISRLHGNSAAIAMTLKRTGSLSHLATIARNLVWTLKPQQLSVRTQLPLEVKCLKSHNAKDCSSFRRVSAIGGALKPAASSISFT